MNCPKKMATLYDNTSVVCINFLRAYILLLKAGKRELSEKCKIRHKIFLDAGTILIIAWSTCNNI